MALFKACTGGCAPTSDTVDLRNKLLPELPHSVYRHRRALLNLYLDYNQLQDLPPLLFEQCTNLNILTASENDLTRIPNQISRLHRLVELDISKNGLINLPDQLADCRGLKILDISCNPLVGTPECVGNIKSLLKLSLSDTSMDFFPKELGTLTGLQILEARENYLVQLPESIGNLVNLKLLDLGGNDLESLCPEIGNLQDLKELWCDGNHLKYLPGEICNLTALVSLDMTNNHLTSIPANINYLQNVCDLYLSQNDIEVLPSSIGYLKNLQICKLDSNKLKSIPDTIRHLSELRELILTENSIEYIPDSLLQLPKLETLNLDQNKLTYLPHTLGDALQLRILSARYNELVELHSNVGKLVNLNVLDVRNNRLKYLPKSLTTLNLMSLWIGESQVKPLLKLEEDVTYTDCMLHPFLPQNDSNTADDANIIQSPVAGQDVPNEQFGAQEVKFDTQYMGGGMVERKKTPGASNRRQLELSAQRAVALVDVKKKVSFSGSPPDVSSGGKKKKKEKKAKTKSKKELAVAKELVGTYNIVSREEESPVRPDVVIKSTDCTSAEGYTTPDLLLDVKQFITEEIEVQKDPQTGLGFTFTGDSDQTKDGIYVKRIIPDTPAANGRLKENDQILEANGRALENMTHQSIAELFRSFPYGVVLLKVQRIVHPISHSPIVYNTSGATANTAAITTIPLKYSYDVTPIDSSSDDEYEKEETLLIKDGKLGMSIVGGGDLSSDPFGRGKHGIYISKILPEGAADRTKVLRVGDKILEVNGMNMRHVSHTTAVEAFTRSGNRINVRVRHVPPPPGIKMVKLSKKEDEPYGLLIRDEVATNSVSISSISATSESDPQELPSKGIFISLIHDNSPASVSGLLEVGQRILEVNNSSLIGLQYKEAVRLLSICTTDMTLIVCDGDHANNNDDTNNSDNNNSNNNNTQPGIQVGPHTMEDLEILRTSRSLSWEEAQSTLTHQTDCIKTIINNLQSMEDSLQDNNNTTTTTTTTTATTTTTTTTATTATTTNNNNNNNNNS